jgi:Cysteine-rich CPCC
MAGSNRREVSGFVRQVDVSLPAAPATIKGDLVERLHVADRRLGVIQHGTERGELSLTLLFSDARDEAAAAERARTLVSRVTAELGLDPKGAGAHRILGTESRRRHPGFPRQVPWPDEAESRAAVLPSGGTLLAAHEGPLGDWIVCIAGAEGEAWKGRDLMAALSELLELPHGKKEPWVYELIADLAGRETGEGIRYACPCCDHFTLEEPPAGSFAICPVCWWEDDNFQFSDPSYPGGANSPSLTKARSNYLAFGASDERLRKHVRSPREDERP